MGIKRFETNEERHVLYEEAAELEAERQAFLAGEPVSYRPGMRFLHKHFKDADGRPMECRIREVRQHATGDVVWFDVYRQGEPRLFVRYYKQADHLAKSVGEWITDGR